MNLDILEEVVSYIDAEHEDSQLVVSLLVKLSRKFAESNVYTKLKSVLVVHRLSLGVSGKAREVLLNTLVSLRSEKDEKTDDVHFAEESIEHAATDATTVAEIQAVEFARSYTSYLFELLHLRSSGSGSDSCVPEIVDESSAVTNIFSSAKVLRLLEQSQALEESTVRLMSTLLGQQCIVAVQEDRQWLLEELQQIYVSIIESAVVLEADKLLLYEVEAALNLHDLRNASALQSVEGRVEVETERASVPGAASRGRFPCTTTLNNGNGGKGNGKGNSRRSKSTALHRRTAAPATTIRAGKKLGKAAKRSAKSAGEER